MTRRIGFFPIMFASFGTTVAFTIPFSARAAEPALAPFEIVRAGDRAMTCTALAGEINALAVAQSVETTPKPKKKGGLGFLRVVASVVPFAGAAGAVGGGLLSSATSVASSAAAESTGTDAMNQANAAIREAATGGSPRQQRKERLTALFDEKGC